MRIVYLIFGFAGLGMDYIAHYLQALHVVPNPETVTFRLMIGWSDGFLRTGQYLPFAVGILAHAMFLGAFVLLALRGR